MLFWSNLKSCGSIEFKFPYVEVNYYDLVDHGYHDMVELSSYEILNHVGPSDEVFLTFIEWLKDYGVKRINKG